MPKLTSKITMKIEPGLLEIIQAKAEAEGLPVSSYIRKAVISYIGERQGSDPNSLEMHLTDMERRAIDRLIRLGVMNKEEDALHTALDLFIKQEYDGLVDRAERLLIDDHTIHVRQGRDPLRDHPRDRSFSDLDLQLEPENGDGE